MPLTSPRILPQVIVIFPDEDIAFDAYRFLQNNGISPENMVLIGEGFTNPDYLTGLLSIRRIARQLARMGAMWGAIVSALVGGFAVILLVIKGWLALMVGSLLFLGCILFFATIGALMGWFIGFRYKSNSLMICRKHLRLGQYVLLLEGSEAVIQRGREILNHYGSRYDL